MIHSPLRRQLLLAAALSPLASLRPLHAAGVASGFAGELAALERRAGGRLGAHLLDTASGTSVAHRSGERFALCSTFKLPLAAVVLREADAGRLALDEVIAFGKDDLVPHAPVTGPRVDSGGMTVVELAEAGQTTSDNVAANLLVRRLGGPAAVTGLFRGLGDTVTRIDRLEPEMNRVAAGDPRDTTTPQAMAELVARLFTTDLLGAASRERLAGWMVATTTGLKRLRAGLPAEWRVGDKTGTAYAPGEPNRHNDVAIAWPPRRPPLVVAAYYEADGFHDGMRPEDDAVLAEVGAIAARWYAAAG
jgi:beta-lactamase class A